MRSIKERCVHAAESKETISEKIWIMVYTHAMSILEGKPLVRIAVQGLDRYMMNGDDFSKDRVLRRLSGLRADREQLYVDKIAIGKERQRKRMNSSHQ